MQRLFTKYLCLAVALALLAVMQLSYVLQVRNAQERMVETSLAKMNQLRQIIKENAKEINYLKKRMDDRVFKSDLTRVKKNILSYSLSLITLEEGTNLFIIDKKTRKIIANKYDLLNGTTLDELGFDSNFLEKYYQGGFSIINGQSSYYVFREYDDLIMGRSESIEKLYENLWKQMGFVLLYLLIVFSLLLIMISSFLRRSVLEGIYQIKTDLLKITNGNLDTIVQVKGNPEFEELSFRINQMVNSILGTTVKVSRIIDLVDAPIGVYEYKNDMNRVLATERLKRILLLTEKEAEELYCDKHKFIEKLNQIKQQREFGEENIYRLSPGVDKWVKIDSVSDSTGTFGIITDVTEDILAKNKIRYERDYDELTGICKRRLFERLVSHKLARGPEFLRTAAMLMFDLDKFKEVNDSYGHGWGDCYLKLAAERLSAISRDKGIAARRSGDEFCLFLFGFASKKEIISLLDGYYRLIETDLIEFPDGTKKKLSMSAGLAWYDEEACSYNELLRKADIALYETKNNNRCTYTIFQETEV
ncbi:MAG: diguanylate cyclase [bacterium]